MKKLACVILAVMMLVSMFAVTASALEPTATSTNLIVTKYQIKQQNGETDRIGNTDALTGTSADAPRGYDTLAGAEFTIFRLGDMNTYVSDSEIAAIDASYKSGKITYNGSVISAFATKTTGNDGKATFNVPKASYGLFFVKETAAPANVTAKAQSFVVMLPKTNTDGTGFLADTYVYPKNYTTLGGGILQKVDSSQNLKLSGAKFALYDAATDKQVTKDFYGNTIGDSTNHYLTTDANGYIYVNNLLVGNYYFVEKVAPTGYIVKSDKYSFSVVAGKSTEVIANNNGTFTYTGISLLTADNSSKPQVQKFVTTVGQKTDNVAFDEEITWIVIADVPSDMGSRYTEYKITDTMDSELQFVNNSITVSTSNGTTYTAKTTGFTAPTSVSGTTFTVNFTNTASLAGVKKIKIEYKTTLKEDITVMGDDIYNNVRLDYKTDVVTESDTEENPPYVYTDGFKFKKTNIDGDVLEGAVFNAYAADGTLVRENITSDANGLFEVKGLTDGEYYLEETKAPKGYELLTTKFNFTVKKGSYTTTSATPVAIVNVATPDVPLTGGIGTTIFTITGFALILSGVVLFVFSRKTKKAN